MGNGRPTADLKRTALDAFRCGSPDAVDMLRAALQVHPHDGQLLISYTAAAAERGDENPAGIIETVLRRAPEWTDGLKALCRIRQAYKLGDPFAGFETALSRMPDDPGIWIAYLGSLSAAGRDLDAAEKCESLRRRIGDIPALRLMRARFLGLGGAAEDALALLRSIPAELEGLRFEQARNALQRGQPSEALPMLDLELGDHPTDMRVWALAALAWRATDDARHSWLMQDGLITRTALDISEQERLEACEALRKLHTARGTPLGQSVRGGTQTRGDLRDFRQVALRPLFSAIEAALSRYAAKLRKLPETHPMSRGSASLEIAASWSIRIREGGYHVPHLHDQGVVSSACHLAVETGRSGGQLELGRPPSDIAIDLEPIASFPAEDGFITLFPSFHYHGTTAFQAGERLSLAFDAV